MGAERTLMLKLLGDTSSIDKSLKGTQRRFAELKKWTRAFALDAVITGVETVSQALQDAWTGFREGEQAAGQLGATWKNLGLDGSKLSGTIDRISESTLKLGTDDVEAINAFNEALQNTGGDSTKAMQRLRIAQDLVANGSAPNLTAAMKLILQAAKGSARVVDRFGLTADTAGGRIEELGKKVRGAAKRKADLDPLGVLFNRMNEDLEGIVGSLASGDLDGALSSMRDIGTALSETWDKIGPAVTGVIDKLTGGTFSQVADDISTKFRPVLDKLVEVIDDMAYAWQNLKPVFAEVGKALEPLFALFSTTAEGGIGFVLDAVGGVIRTVAELLKGDFSAAWETAGDTVARLKTDIETIVGGVLTFLQDILGKIGKVAGDIGGGIFRGISGAVSKLVQFIARTWNSLGAFGPGGFTFAEAFQFEVLGQKFGWPKLAVEWGAGDIIPNISVPGTGGGKSPQGMGNYAKGLWDVPQDMAAIIHRGESIVPADFAQQMRANGGYGGGTVNVVVNVPPTANMADVGREITKALKAYGQGGGQPNMKSAIGVG